jgi:hypothetical protein
MKEVVCIGANVEDGEVTIEIPMYHDVWMDGWVVK